MPATPVFLRQAPRRDKSGYWPPGIDRIASIDAFVAAFSKLGYSTVTEGDLSNNMDRVALYVDAVDNEPTHMARQCDDGMWKSKLGFWYDVVHQTPQALEGKRYGKGRLIMGRGGQ